MDGYAIEHQGKVFTPDGQRDIADVTAHNAATESAELDAWAKQPDRWQVYVTKCALGEKVATWLGTPLGTITGWTRFSTNISRNMVAIRFKGTNGATYYGRFGSDWSQLCRVRKVA